MGLDCACILYHIYDRVRRIKYVLLILSIYCQTKEIKKVERNIPWTLDIPTQVNNDTDFLTFVSHMPELDSLIGQEPKICPLKCAETPPSCSENIILLPR